MLITLEEAKTYLRVDSILEEPLILSLLPAAEKTVMDVARLDAQQWETVCDPQTESLMLRGTLLSHAEIMMIRDLLRTAVFFTLRYALIRAVPMEPSALPLHKGTGKGAMKR